MMDHGRTVIVLLIGIFSLSKGDQNYTIITQLGNVDGLILSTSEGEVYRFAGIPFGKAPVGDLRFRKPLPYGSWNDSLNARKFGPACMQSHGEASLYESMSEDCLQLNIYVPFNVTQEEKRSVMVYIHGGGYMTGSAIAQDGSKIALYGNVILVTINYRLGMFGFPSLQNSNVDENVGIWDQMLALKWIKNNIEDYGGNSSDITIFGESAGGFSVNLLMLISQNKGLFHRAILQSGTANAHVAFKRSSDVGRQIGIKAGCNNRDPVLFLQCMKKIDSDIIVNKTDEYSSTLGIDVLTEIAFTPILDNDLFRKTPEEIILDEASAEFQFFQSIDMITGNCDEEGAYVAKYSALFEKQYNFNVSDGITKRFLCEGVIPSIAKYYYKNSSSIADRICQEYTSNDTNTQSMNAVDLMTDFHFIYPAVLMLRAHASSSQSSTYQYIFAEDIRVFYPDMPAWFHGTGHATELAFFFDARDMMATNFTLSTKQLQFAKRLIKYWTNFAKTG